MYLQVVLVHVQAVYTAIYKSVLQAAGIIYALRCITKLIRSYLRVRLIALSGFKRAVATLLRLLHLPEDLFQ